MISPKRLDDLMQVDSKVIHNLALLKQNLYQWISNVKSEEHSGSYMPNQAKVPESHIKQGFFRDLI